jgi:two-component system, OmpR family, alkaline phosphatase synthesis response regulator PhoP
VQGRVLIVEDEPDLAGIVAERCAAAGLAAEVCADGNAALRRATSEEWAIVLLDLSLPGRDGILVCQEMRSLGVRTPVIMMTARREIADRVAGLRCGADDYVTKPFEMVELMARIEAVLRRSGGDASAPGRAAGTGASAPGTAALGPLRFGDCALDPVQQTLTTPSAGFRLHAMEYRLLLFFVGQPDRVWTRDELLDLVWGDEAVVGPRTVDVYIASIRKMLHGSSRVGIETLRHQGYALRVVQ